MTEYGLPFDGLILGDASKAPYSAAEWARNYQLRHSVGDSFPNYGVFSGTGGGTYIPLEVRATSPASANVEVQVGAALVNGRFYENTAAKTLTVNSNSSGNPRIDTVILRLDFAAQTIRLAIKQGTPAASPSRPSMQQDTVYWEIPLANIAVANGFTTLAQSTINQRHRHIISAQGWMPYATHLSYVPNANYDAATISVSSGGGANLPTLVMPVMIAAPILIEDVILRVASTGVAYSWGWDIYVQDVNDGNTAENTLRKLVASNGEGTGTLGGAGNENLTLAPLGGPQALGPGLYWLAVRNSHASQTLGIKSVAAGSGTFGPTTYKFLGIALGANQTLDFVGGGWVSQTSVPGVRIRGRVFGQTTAF